MCSVALPSYPRPTYIEMPSYLQVAGALVLACWCLAAVKRLIEHLEQEDLDEDIGPCSDDKDYDDARWRAGGFRGL